MADGHASCRLVHRLARATPTTSRVRCPPSLPHFSHAMWTLLLSQGGLPGSAKSTTGKTTGPLSTATQDGANAHHAEGRGRTMLSMQDLMVR